jgi:hypothetical protein
MRRADLTVRSNKWTGRPKDPTANAQSYDKIKGSTEWGRGVFNPHAGAHRRLPGAERLPHRRGGEGPCHPTDDLITHLAEGRDRRRPAVGA